MFLNQLFEGLRNPKDNPCWKGYHPVGTKEKDGRTVPNCVPKESVEEASPDTTFNLLKGLKSWQVVIMNNYYRGKYADYSGRYYYVLATSPEQARQVVLDNADAILQDLLSMKSVNGKKILPRGSAVRITADRIGDIRDGTEAGRMTTAGFKRMFGPQGPMMVKLNNGAVADVQGQEQGVAEGSEHISSMIQQYEDMVELVYDLPPGRKKNIAIDKRDALEAQIEAMPGGKEALRKWAKSYNDAMDEGVAEGVEIIDQDSDLDQQVYTLNVDGNKVSFTYWDYENNFQSPDIKDIYQQAKEQLGKKLSLEQIKAVARAVFKSFKQGVAEAYQFKGGFPFDVDHMPGSVIRNRDETTDVIKTKNKDRWDDEVDRINDEVFDDMSDFRTDSKGETVTGNSAVWAKWDNRTQTGWINRKGNPLKPWPVKEQGVAEGLQPDADLAVIGVKILNALKGKCEEIDRDYPHMWETFTSDEWIESGQAYQFVADYVTVDKHTLQTFFRAWDELGTTDPFQYWPLFWRDGQWDDFIAPWKQYAYEVLKSRGVNPTPPGTVHEGVAEGKDNLESLRAKAKQISDKIDSIVQSGGRVGLDDPLSRQLKAIRNKIKQAKQGVAEAIPYALSAANANAEFERTKTHVPQGYRGRVDAEVSDKEEYQDVMVALKKAARAEGQHVECGLSGNQMSIFSKTMDSSELDEFVDNVLSDGLTEGKMSEVDQIIRDIVSGDMDAYTVMTRPQSDTEQHIAQILEREYEEVARNHRLHPDDDFEQILDIVVDNLAQDYGVNELDEAQPEKIAGRYEPDEFDQMVLRLKQKAKEQERKHGPVDLNALAKRLRGIEQDGRTTKGS